MNTLQHQRVVVTGANGGIAQATISRLLEAGADVVVSARNEQKLATVLDSLEGSVEGYVMDLLSPDSIRSFFDQVGAFDHLATPAASSMFAPIRDMNFEQAEQIVSTKQWGQLYSVHYGSRRISEHGSITLFSGTVTQKPIEGSSMFAAVGGATEAAARIWAFDLAPLRVNTVVPGIIDTPVWPGLVGADGADSALAAMADVIPVQRVGTPDDVAKAVLFLIDNSFVNGHSLVVDGGHRLI